MKSKNLRTCAVLCLALLGCGHSIDGPQPNKTTAAALDPPAVCIEQLDTLVTFAADGLSPLPTKVLEDRPELVLPELALQRSKDLGGDTSRGTPLLIPDDPAAPDESRVRWLDSTRMTFEVFPELGLDPGLYSLRVTNANGREAWWADVLLGVPRPTIESAVPDLLCAPKGGIVNLDGDMFAHLGTELPQVSATSRGGGYPEPLPSPLLDDCKQLPGGSGIEACAKIVLSIAGDKLPAAEPYETYDLQVTNPDPVGCHSTDSIPLTMVPAPVLESIEPELACTAQGDNTLTLKGKGFLRVGDEHPTVSFGSFPMLSTASDCTVLPDTKTGAESCKTLTVAVPKDTIPAGSYAVVVTNPTPADCATSEPVSFVVAPPPQVDALKPGVICETSDEMTVSVEGSGFLTVQSASGVAVPTVVVGSETFSDATAEDCTTVEGLVATVQTCNRLVIKVPKGLLAVGAHSVTVTNPPPADCSSENDVSLRLVEPPTVTGVTPAKLCVGGGSLVVNGTNFFEGIGVDVGGVAADAVTVVSDTELSASFGAMGQAGGPFDLTVSYSESCGATLATAVSIVPGPQLFFADPPVAYNGITTQITLYGSGFSGALTGIGIRIAGTQDALTPLTFDYDPLKPNQVQAIVPEQTPAETYDVVLTDQTSCAANLVGGLKVVDKVTLHIDSVLPPFGHTDATTAVTVFADAAVGGGFQPVPRLYLNPTTATKASAIGAVAFVDASRVTALVPKGLPVDTYDLIAVNPDGGVGLLAQAFKVTPLPPPALTSMTPGSIMNNAGQAVTLTGSDFRNPTALMRCIPSGTTAEQAQAIPVSSFTAEQASLVVDASPYQNGAICVVRVINDDGTYAEIPGLVITNPAQNLSAFSAGPAMATGRRALASVGNQATTAARFVYAIGGDAGDTNNTFDTVEVAPVDLFGKPGAFFTQHNKLSSARSYAAAATVGRCIYVVGGISGSTVLGSVERACVLDPAERPQIVDLTLDTSTTGGLDPGVWYYQISALMPTNHPSNPGGETLPSEPFPLLVPALNNRKITVAVHWSQVPGATGYRIYRSPAADAAADALELLAEVDATVTSHADAGATAQGDTPLRLGSTGKWHTLSSALAVPRRGAGVSIAPDFTDASRLTHYLHVMGGHDGTKAEASYEMLKITINVDDSQTVSAFSTGAAAMGKARWQMGLFSVGTPQAPYIPTSTWFIYAGGGVASNGTTEIGDVEAFAMQADGTLGTPVPVDSMQPSRAGYGHTAAHNFLFVFGANKAMPDETITSIRICADGSVQQCEGGPPELENWNNAGGNLLVQARYLLSSAVQSGFIYLLGGKTKTSNASATTEYAHW